MAGVLDSVNQRTQLVGQNRLELLLFRLDSDQIYGVNVFKVREVLQCPPLTNIPKSHSVVRGVAHIRTRTIPIIDMGRAIGRSGVESLDDSFVIITEYNMMTQGFLVHGVERIVNTNWEEIHPPPAGAGRDHYLTAITEVDSNIVEIIDVEKILSEVVPLSEQVSDGLIEERMNEGVQENLGELEVLICDDSRVALEQVKGCLRNIGLSVTEFYDGMSTLNHLKELCDQGIDPNKKYLMLISDIEMPEMDGYTLCSNIRSDPRLEKMYVLLHTSLSGIFNKAMVDKVGADNFVAKFKPDLLAGVVIDRLNDYDPLEGTQSAG